MSTAVILAGGVGNRLNSNIPKQYISVNDRPVFSFCLETFEENENTGSIIIVADKSRYQFISDWVEKLGIKKFKAFAPPGKTRQHSIKNGLICARQYTHNNDIVIIHDAARPLVSNTLIDNGIKACSKKDGAMPVIAVKDTVYKSVKGDSINGLLDRNELFAGQTPEFFNFSKYLSVNERASDEELCETAGSSAIAFSHGMDIALIKGDEMNFKITTKEDLASFIAIMSDKKEQ